MKSMTDRLKQPEQRALLAFVLIFLVAPFYFQHNIGGEGLNLPANVTIWLAAVLLIVVAVFQMLKSKSILLPNRLIWFLAFPILVTISGFVTGVTEPTEWFFRLLYIWLGILFLIAIFQIAALAHYKHKLLFIISFSGFLHAIIAISQLYQPDGVSLWIPSPAQGSGPVGMFQQINNQASFQGTILLLNWFLLLSITVKSRATQVFILLSSALSSFVIMASGSRVGLLGVIIGLPVLLVFIRELLKTKCKLAGLMILAMGVGGWLALSTGGIGKAIEKAQTEYTSSARVGIYTISAELMMQKPIFGHGIGSFESVWQFQKADYQQRHPHADLINEYVKHPHNEIIFWQVEGGLLATVGFLISAITVLLVVLNSPQTKYIIALLIPITLHMMVELPFYTSALHWFLYLTLITLGINQQVAARNIQLSSLMSATLYLSASLLVFSTFLFSIHTLQVGKLLDAATKGETVVLSPVIQNPYFSSIGEDFAMQQLFMFANESQSIDALEKYVSWAEKYIVVHPNYLHLKYLIASYQILDRKESACHLAMTSSLMYKKNEEFQSYRDYCERIK